MRCERIERVGSDAMKLYFYHFPKLSCVPITHTVIERLLAAVANVVEEPKRPNFNLV